MGIPVVVIIVAIVVGVILLLTAGTARSDRGIHLRVNDVSSVKLYDANSSFLRARKPQHRDNSAVHHHIQDLQEYGATAHPMDLFSTLHKTAAKYGGTNTHYCVLSTIALDGGVASRHMSLAFSDASSLYLLAANGGDKSAQIARNNRGAIVFYWKNIDIQIRFRGSLRFIHDQSHHVISSAAQHLTAVKSRQCFYSTERGCGIPSYRVLQFHPEEITFDAVQPHSNTCGTRIKSIVFKKQPEPDTKYRVSYKNA